MKQGLETLHVAERADNWTIPRVDRGNPISPMSPIEVDESYELDESLRPEEHEPYLPEYVRKSHQINASNEAREEEFSPEKILGAYEYLPFQPSQLISLSQIRGERNIVTNELKEDILFQGLINPVDVSFVTHELLEEYILFTNETWDSDSKIEDFAHLRLPDGRYPLLTSGHSRVTAVEELVAEEKLPPYTKIMAKVTEDDDIFAIIHRQRGENIHSQPPRERTAMALVESYMHGLNTGAWENEDEFIEIQKENGRVVTKGPLVHALKYAKLVPRIRNFILSGEVPYLAGVELGASVDVLSEYIARTNGYDGVTDARLVESTEAMAKVQKVVELELDRLCNRITGENLNSTASQKVVQGSRNAWLEASKSMRQTKTRRVQSSLNFEFAEDALDAAVLASQVALKRELSETKHRYAGHNIPTFLKLQQGILPEADVRELLTSFKAELERTDAALGALGALGTAAALYEDDLFGGI